MEEWKEYQLKDATTVLGDGLHGTPKYDENGTVFFINGNNLVDGKIEIKESTKRVSEDEANKYKKNLNSRTILVSINGTIGNVAKYQGEACILGKSACYFNVSEDFDLNFIYYVVASKQFKNSITHLSTGTTIKNVSLETMRNYSFAAPSINEQKRIAELLSSLDDKIELNHRINDNLEQQAQALFKSWFVDFEPFRDGKFVDSELGTTPKELPIVYIQNIPHNIESGKRPKGGATLKGIPSIGAENIKGLGYYDYSKTKYIPQEYAQTIKKGKINGYELLIYKDGGKPGYFIPNFSIFGEGFPFSKMYINEHVFLLDLMDNGYNAFAYFYMHTPYIINQFNSNGGKAAIPGINTKDVECLPIYSKESPYVKRFGEIVLPFIKTILSNSLENARLAKMRDTLLPKLMSGKLKISEIEI
ncbi:restriction endonuclease subunit S [Bacteroides finegoldii]|uniref:restriction endonuclease subunit S n=3 Tax=Bacteroides TaxID=816 RepID=UPI0018A04180|nr:restriction endonuclease subunit S [Bacteroides finegoldii]